MPITLTSRFTPLTYDEITRPLIEQTQAQEALENAYMEASDQASQIMAQANEQTDPIAYARLKNYSEALQQQADSLIRQGLNSNSRQSLLNLRRRYNQDIIPIQAAVNRRNELMQERHQLRLTHPDILQERDVISVDDLLRNPNMDLVATLYGSDLSKRAAAITSAISKGRQSIALGQNLDKYTQTVLNQSGLTAEEIQAALAGDDTPVSKALHSLYASTGVDNWANETAKQSVWNYISEGAMQGVGEFRIGTQADYDARRRAEYADYVSKLQAQIDIANGDENLGGVKAHKAGYHVDSDGKKIEIYEDNNGDYYVKDSTADGKVKRFVKTDLTPTFTSSSSRTSSGEGTGSNYIQTISNPIQIIGGEVNEVTDTKQKTKGEGRTVFFNELSREHKEQVLRELGYSIEDYTPEGLKMLCQELDKYYKVKERVATPEHKNSRWDWVEVEVKGNTRKVDNASPSYIPAEVPSLIQKVPVAKPETTRVDTLGLTD